MMMHYVMICPRSVGQGELFEILEADGSLPEGEVQVIRIEIACTVCIKCACMCVCVSVSMRLSGHPYACMRGWVLLDARTACTNDLICLL